MIGRAEFRGKGYGTEAMRLRARYAFEELGLESLVSFARADNARSIGALKRAGYQEVGVFKRFHYAQDTWYDRWLGQLLREDWERERTKRPYPRTIGIASGGSFQSEDSEDCMRAHWKPEWC
jgi:RimJ/RimL family protein N-acetyltransferase